MKRTNIALDEKLVRQGLKATGIKTRRALVNHALTELVRREKQTGLLELKGRVSWDGNLATIRRTNKPINFPCNTVSLFTGGARCPQRAV